MRLPARQLWVGFIRVNGWQILATLKLRLPKNLWWWVRILVILINILLLFCSLFPFKLFSIYSQSISWPYATATVSAIELQCSDLKASLLARLIVNHYQFNFSGRWYGFRPPRRRSDKFSSSAWVCPLRVYLHRVLAASWKPSAEMWLKGENVANYYRLFTYATASAALFRLNVDTLTFTYSRVEACGTRTLWYSPDPTFCVCLLCPQYK